MKRIKLIMVISAVLSVLTGISGCTKKNTTSQEKKLSVVTALFPQFDWTRSLIEGSENVKLELLVKNGTDLHSFQPSTEDIVKINNADLFIFTGGESDEWVYKVLENSKNDNQIVISLMSVLGENVKKEELIEGMQTEVEEESEEEFDEHVWLGLQNVKIAVEKIAEALEILDLANSNFYVKNLIEYHKKLDLLAETENRISERAKNSPAVLIFCDRFPFRYLIDELELDYYAAFSGCSAETEASFETVAFLAEKTGEIKPTDIFVTESSDLKLAQTVINESKLKVNITRLNSMQNVTLKQANSGMNYIDIMKDNLSKIDSVIQ